jgi:ATP-dependent Clp protease ATP-binding subunit ClpA
VIDKGEWTNKKLSQGKGGQTETISCQNILFIMTTNAADRFISDAARSAPQLYTSTSVDELEDLQSSVEKTIRQKLQSTHPFTANSSSNHTDPPTRSWVR